MTQGGNGGSTGRAGTRLSGWKEIAAYLGKGVRTVQRWERNYGLPVHRIGQQGGEIVYAEVAELEEWLRTAEHRLAEVSNHPHGATRADDHAPDTGADTSPSPRPAPLAPRPWWRRGHLAALAGVIGLIVLVGASLAWRSNHTGPSIAGNPATWSYTNDLLTVYDARNTLLWNHRLHGLREIFYHTRPPGAVGGPPVVVEDLEGDGSTEVLFLAMATRGSDAKLWCFNADGSVRFSHQPESAVRFGTTDYGQPFPVSQFFVARDPALAGSIWVVSLHNLEFPAVVERVTSAGEVTGQYWNAGHVWTVAEARLRGRPVLMFGATRNEGRDASFTVLDATDPGGRSPGLDARYVCSSSAARDPLEFLVFPRSRLAVLENQRCYVREIRQEPDGGVILTVLQGDLGVPPDPNPWPATAYYRFDQDLKLVDAWFDDDYKRIHSRLFLSHLLKREFGPWTIRELFPVRRWNGSTLEAMPVPRK